MRGLRLPDMETALLTLITVVRLASPVRTSRACGGAASMNHARANCMVGYNDLLSSLQIRQQKFYSGLDVETIRQTCQSLRDSVSCMKSEISSQCPDNTNIDAIIEPVVSDLMNVVKLCSYQNLYEVYARHMSCYQRHVVLSSSEACYHTYRRQTDNIMQRVHQGQSDATKQMCLDYKSLVDCIKSQVDSHCTSSASELTELLVAPSIQLSEQCTEEQTTTTLKPTVAVIHSKQSGQERSTGGGDSGTNTSTQLRPQTAILSLLVLLTLVKL